MSPNMLQRKHKTLTNNNITFMRMFKISLQGEKGKERRHIIYMLGDKVLYNAETFYIYK